MQSHIAVFETDMRAFTTRTLTRLLGEFCLSVVAAIVLLYPSLLGSIPGWGRLIVGALIVGYFLYDLLSYPISKRMANRFRLYVYDDGIGLLKQGVPKKVSFTDIRGYKLQKNGNQVVGIKLETRFGFSIDLSGLRNMNELHSILEPYLSVL